MSHNAANGILLCVQFGKVDSSDAARSNKNHTNLSVLDQCEIPEESIKKSKQIRITNRMDEIWPFPSSRPISISFAIPLNSPEHYPLHRFATTIIGRFDLSVDFD